ncbi:MAG: hypothetical protein IJU23_11010 [Proteobacteria bacterium]|nr:hypothetical protein [Pseudomonadota bacterium]
MKEATSKLWKVIVEISHARSDGNGEAGRETRTRFFDDFRSATYFAEYGDIPTNDFFACVASRKIFEYDICSVRQLELKKRETVHEVKETKWCWE